MDVAIASNGLRLCAGGGLERKSFKLAQKPNRITAVEFRTSAHLHKNDVTCRFFSVGSSKLNY